VDAFDRANEKQIEAGKLTSLDNQVDTTTGTIKFRAEFPTRISRCFPTSS
jgi:multidrug efflux system membrane fusion protein